MKSMDIIVNTVEQPKQTWKEMGSELLQNPTVYDIIETMYVMNTNLMETWELIKSRSGWKIDEGVDRNVTSEVQHLKR